LFGIPEQLNCKKSAVFSHHGKQLGKFCDSFLVANKHFATEYFVGTDKTPDHSVHVHDMILKNKKAALTAPTERAADMTRIMPYCT